MSDVPEPDEFREHARRLRDAADGLIVYAEIHQDLADKLEESDGSMDHRDIDQYVENEQERISDDVREALKELGI